MSRHRHRALLFCVLAFCALSIPLACGNSSNCAGPSGLCVRPPSAAAGEQILDASVGVSGSTSAATGADSTGASDDSAGAAQGGVGAGDAAGGAHGGDVGILEFPDFAGSPSLGGGVGGVSGGVGAAGESGGPGKRGTDGKAGDLGIGGGKPVKIEYWSSCPSATLFTSTCAAPPGELGDGGAPAVSTMGHSACGPDEDGAPDAAAGAGGAAADGSIDTAEGAAGAGPASRTLLLLDDFEDGDTRSKFLLNARGYWFSISSGVPGQLFPAPDCPFVTSLLDASISDGSSIAIHSYGLGFGTRATDYAQVGVTLHAGAPQCLQPVDASNLTGVRFKARTGTLAPSAFGLIRLYVKTVLVASPDNRGTCTGVCFDSHGATVAVTDQWTEYFVPFTQLTQQGWGTPAPFLPSQILDLLWSPTVDQYGSLAPCFDYWIDDVAFYKEQ